MKLKQTIKLFIAGLVLATGLVAASTLSGGPIASAADSACDPATENCCGGVKTSIISCEETGGTDVEDTGIWGVLLMAINILTAGVGIAAVGGLVFASILYTSAGGNQEQLKKAYGYFTNIAIGIIAYALMFSFLNFIIPGGLFATT